MSEVQRHSPGTRRQAPCPTGGEGALRGKISRCSSRLQECKRPSAAQTAQTKIGLRIRVTDGAEVQVDGVHFWQATLPDAVCCDDLPYVDDAGFRLVERVISTWSSRRR